MKLTVLTDQAGKVLATQYTPGLVGTGSPGRTKIQASTGQQVHEVDIPAELQQHLLENTLAQEISKYRVERHGKTAKLVKGS
jgi:hypothetical protein